MARYVQAPCAPCKETMTLHRVLGLGESGDQVLSCDKCTNTSTKVAPQRISRKKTTWPYYHEGCGMTFESESHEQKFAAANKLTKE